MLKDQKNIILLFIILIVLLGLAVYGNSLNGKFIYDDEGLIKNNTYIKNWSYVSKVFGKDIGAGFAGKSKLYSYSYRPLQMITYMLDYSFWGLNVQGYHLTNILLHLLVALAIYWLVNLLYNDRLLSLLTSIFFVVHPIHTGAVAYISGRADPLAVLFMLLCFIFYIKGWPTKSTAFYLFVPLSYTFALLSRENSLILPLLLLLYHYSFKEDIKVKQFLPILGITFIYITLRFTLLKSILPHLSFSSSLLQRLPGFFVAITNYLRLIFLPFNLHMEYGEKLFHFTHPQAILGILILTSLLIYSFRKRNSHSLIFFSISWFFIALLPCSNLYPLKAYMAEHWLYLPSIGFFLILAQGLSYLYKTKELRILAIFFTVSLLAYYSYLTIRQNNYWKEPITFYERALAYTPQSLAMLNNLGLAYSDIGQKEKAAALFKRAIEIAPDNAVAYNNLGSLYLSSDIGQKEKAITLFKKAIELNPNYVYAYNNLGWLYYNLGRNEEAIALFKKALEINPDYAEAYNNLGGAYYNIGKNDVAIALAKKAIKLNPDYGKAYHNLAVAYFRKKQYNLAIEYCDKAGELGFIEAELLKDLKPYRKE